jgi:acyl-CoA reductase-like NAD-dependent aldehyde dehydrogenase
LADVDATRADAEHLMPPTLILQPGDDAKVMQDEIFGPILPILGYALARRGHGLRRTPRTPAGAVSLQLATARRWSASCRD